MDQDAEVILSCLVILSYLLNEIRKNLSRKRVHRNQRGRGRTQGDTTKNG